jgi:hypothetical protein
MVEVYSKMKPDAFTLQLQTVLTAYYEDIKRGVSASGCTKSKVVKRKFEDQDDADAAAAVAAAAAEAPPAEAPPATPATPPDGAAAGNAPGGEEPPAAPSQSGAGRGARGGGARKAGGKA